MLPSRSHALGAIYSFQIPAPGWGLLTTDLAVVIASTLLHGTQVRNALGLTPNWSSIHFIAPKRLSRISLSLQHHMCRTGRQPHRMLILAIRPEYPIVSKACSAVRHSE